MDASPKTRISVVKNSLFERYLNNRHPHASNQNLEGISDEIYYEICEKMQLDNECEWHTYYELKMDSFQWVLIDKVTQRQVVSRGALFGVLEAESRTLNSKHLGQLCKSLQAKYQNINATMITNFISCSNDAERVFKHMYHLTLNEISRIRLRYPAVFSYRSVLINYPLKINKATNHQIWILVDSHTKFMQVGKIVKNDVDATVTNIWECKQNYNHVFQSNILDLIHFSHRHGNELISKLRDRDPNWLILKGKCMTESTQMDIFRDVDKFIISETNYPKNKGLEQAINFICCSWNSTLHCTNSEGYMVPQDYLFSLKDIGTGGLNCYRDAIPVDVLETEEQLIKLIIACNKISPFDLK